MGVSVSSSDQIAFYGLTTAEKTNLMFYQKKVPHPISLRQNPYK